MKLDKLKGTGVALVTPFHKDGSIDFKSFKKLIDRCISGNVDYLVPLGTTGETVTLGADERRAVMDFVVEANAGRVPVMMGLGGNNTAEILRAFDFYDFSGIDAILSVSPYYNRPSQRGIFQHYRMIADESPVPVIAYNVPSRTGSNIDAQTALELAHEVPNLVGIKEASGNLERAMKIIQGKPKDFLVISGDDALTLPMIACGADGLISVIANAFPKETSEMVSSALAGNYDKARKLHYRLLDITNLIFSDGSPSGIKALLSLQRVCQEHVRMPLVSASKSLMNKMEAVI